MIWLYFINGRFWWSSYFNNTHHSLIIFPFWLVVLCAVPFVYFRIGSYPNKLLLEALYFWFLWVGLWIVSNYCMWFEFGVEDHLLPSDSYCYFLNWLLSPLRCIDIFIDDQWTTYVLIYFEFATLFHCSVYLLSCHYHTILINVAFSTCWNYFSKPSNFVYHFQNS